MSTHEQLIRKNNIAAGITLIFGAFCIGWLVALGFAADVFDLDPRPVTKVARDIVWATELR